MVNFIQRRRRNEAFNKILQEKQKKEKQAPNFKLALLSIVFFAAHYIYQIEYIEILGFIILAGVTANLGKRAGKEEWYQQGFFDGYEKALDKNNLKNII